MSTSALSHALSRLREFLQDPLFYRDGHRMCPSVYAGKLAPFIAEALSALNYHLCPAQPFAPLTSDECFKIAITDYTAFSVFPALMHEIQDKAPEIRFELCYLPHNPALIELLAGEIDLALGFSEPEAPANAELEEVDLFSDEFVVIGNAQRNSLTLNDYISAKHLVVTPWNEQLGLLDAHLERAGLTRHISLKTPSMLGAPFIVAQSELLMAIPTFVARTFEHVAGVTTFPLPFKAPRFTVKIYTHRRSGKRTPVEWLKKVICESVKGEGGIL